MYRSPNDEKNETMYVGFDLTEDIATDLMIAYKSSYYNIRRVQTTTNVSKCLFDKLHLNIGLL